MISCIEVVAGGDKSSWFLTILQVGIVVAVSELFNNNLRGEIGFFGVKKKILLLKLQQPL